MSNEVHSIKSVADVLFKERWPKVLEEMKAAAPDGKVAFKTKFRRKLKTMWECRKEARKQLGIPEPEKKPKPAVGE